MIDKILSVFVPTEFKKKEKVFHILNNVKGLELPDTYGCSSEYVDFVVYCSEINKYVSISIQDNGRIHVCMERTLYLNNLLYSDLYRCLKDVFGCFQEFEDYFSLVRIELGQVTNSYLFVLELNDNINI